MRLADFVPNSGKRILKNMIPYFLIGSLMPLLTFLIIIKAFHFLENKS